MPCEDSFNMTRKNTNKSSFLQQLQVCHKNTAKIHNTAEIKLQCKCRHNMMNIFSHPWFFIFPLLLQRFIKKKKKKEQHQHYLISLIAVAVFSFFIWKKLIQHPAENSLRYGEMWKGFLFSIIINYCYYTQLSVTLPSTSSLKYRVRSMSHKPLWVTSSITKLHRSQEPC